MFVQIWRRKIKHNLAELGTSDIDFRHRFKKSTFDSDTVWIFKLFTVQCNSLLHCTVNNLKIHAVSESKVDFLTGVGSVRFCILVVFNKSTKHRDRILNSDAIIYQVIISTAYTCDKKCLWHPEAGNSQISRVSRSIHGPFIARQLLIYSSDGDSIDLFVGTIVILQLQLCN